MLATQIIKTLAKFSSLAACVSLGTSDAPSLSFAFSDLHITPHIVKGSFKTSLVTGAHGAFHAIKMKTKPPNKTLAGCSHTRFFVSTVISAGAPQPPLSPTWSPAQSSSSSTKLASGFSTLTCPLATAGKVLLLSYSPLASNGCSPMCSPNSSLKFFFLQALLFYK